MVAELEVLGSARVLAGTRADLQVRCFRDGVLATPTGTLTFSAADADGTVVASGTATTDSAAPGVLTATLTAAQATVNRLTVTWGGLVFGAEDPVSVATVHDVVGEVLFTVGEVRSNTQAQLNDEARYPTVTIAQTRDLVTEVFESHLGFRLGRQHRRVVYDGTGTVDMFLYDREIGTVRNAWTRQSGSQTWTAFTADELAALVVTRYGRIVRENGGAWPRGTQNVRLSYECGRQPIPRELRQAGLTLLRQIAVPSNIDPRITQQVGEMGTFVYSVPGRGGALTGIPEVDEVLKRLSEHQMVSA